MTGNQVALITGSASGIGAGIARRLAADGMRVVINSRSPGPGTDLAESLPGAIYVQADVSVPEQAERLVAETVERCGRLDALINNAGTTEVIPHGDLDSATVEVWRRILDLNVLGTWQLSAIAASHLKHSDSGTITNISSVAGSRPAGSSIPYAVSKAAIEHMTRLLAKALGPRIRVNAVAPGLIETPWTSDDPFFAAIAEKVREATPLGRVGNPEDVAEAVAGVLAARYLTGAVVPVDGGAHLI
ncbi:SDR family NAD(P)-dependent oxidoreductase [Saccharopolyspora gloriosae]|uniref:SDR family NAD(P)-dependent oxidoreductase n=1 Tax=Saccharopolyspora gloriosae TaxID=455344 RepID=UPI001FB764B7|nr:SDR family oxidoreductase [Saccharopolyspora gloriosae]